MSSKNGIQGVDFHRYDSYALCYIYSLSDELKELVRENLSTICYGSQVGAYLDDPMYNYQSTIHSFLERYKKKSPKTKKGMIGEFLSHILITRLFDEYDITSAFFNLEEKSIKKGFDLLLYNSLERTVWITEVKSGNLHSKKTHDQTTLALLSKARNDLDERLNEQEVQYWHNAINHVRAAVHDETDYRGVLLKLLREEFGGRAAKGQATSHDKNVFLISNLFASFDTKLSDIPAKTLAESLSSQKTFENTVVLSIQKATYEKIVDFLHSEVE